MGAGSCQPISLSESVAVLACRLAESDEELQAAAWLRAQSFYVYPPERAFAGEVCARERVILQSGIGAF